MATEKSSFGETVIGILFLGAIVFGFQWLHSAVWGEQEGYIKTADCRKTIPVKEGSFDTWFKKFTCTYEKTNSGKIFSGTCAAVETDGVACGAAYVYEKKTEIKGCTDPKYPYPGRDDLCHSDIQY